MPRDLRTLAREQAGLFTRQQALLCHDRQFVDARIAIGDWVLVRRGVYTWRANWLRHEDDPARRHLLEAVARCLVTGGDTVVSHESVAGVLGIPLLEEVTGEPRLTVHTPACATAGGIDGRYLAWVPAHHRMLVHGVPLTIPARAVADLCRTQDGRVAAVAADAALRWGVAREDVLGVLAECRRWPHVVGARETVRHASRWSESALESLALRWCRVQGLPLPEQQLTVRTVDGRFVARVDFLWEAQRTVAEVDGRLKYDDSPDLPAGVQIAGGRVVWEEKLREDRLRDLGLEVARGYWADDKDDGAQFAARVRRAFARGSSYTGTPTYRIVDERDHAQPARLAS